MAECLVCLAALREGGVLAADDARNDPGTRIKDRLVFQALITQSLLVLIVGVLSLIGGVIISQRMLRRVDELARTANTIIQGDLGTRLPVQGIGDEFDRVARTSTGCWTRSSA